MPRCQPASPRCFTRGLVPPRLCLFVCVPVFRQRQKALSAILFLFFFFSFFLFSRCDFLLSQGRLVIRLRAPPTWRLPTPSILSSQITPATASEKSSYLEAANAIHPEQPDRTSHYVCSLCPSQSLNPKDVLNLCPSQSLNPPAVTVSGTSKSRYRPYRSPPTSTLHSYYCSS